MADLKLWEGPVILWRGLPLILLLDHATTGAQQTCGVHPSIHMRAAADKLELAEITAERSGA